MKSELNQKIYKTADFQIAIFLLANDFSLLELDRSNPSKAFFTFEDKPERQILMEKFWADEPVVGCKRLFQAQRELKQRLYGEDE